MTIIDFHTHAFPDSLAERAITSLAAQGDHNWRARLDGRVSSLLASMDAAGVARSIVCPIATKPRQFDGILKWCSDIRSERIVPLASMHPAAADPADQVRQIKAAGLIGLKMHPMYQDFDVDDAILDPLYQVVADAGLLLVMHCGQDIAFPGSLRAQPHQIAAVLDRHRDLRFVATHLGGWKSWDQVREHLVGRDLWMETSFSLDWLDQAEAAELMLAHGCDKLLFGTDSPWTDQAEQIALVNQLSLTDSQKTAILGENAHRLLAGFGV